jgi:antitoxin VapB
MFASDRLLPVGNTEFTIMTKQHLTEKELLTGLDAHKAHADELAEPLPQELTPLERLKGSVKRYDRPTDPVWDEFSDSEENIDDDRTENRNPPS